MPSITSENAALAIVKLVAAQALPALMANLVMGNLVNRDFEPTLANAGDTVNVPLPPTMVANNIAEAGSVNTQNPNLGNAQLVLNTHAEASFQIPDVTKVIAVPDLLQTYLQPSVIAIAEKIESDLFASAIGFTANSAVGTYNTALTESVIDSAEKALFDSKVPDSEPKFLVLGSKGASEIRQVSRFTEYQTIGSGQSIVNGQIGTIKNMKVFRSQLVYASGNNTSNLAFAKNALGLVIRRLPQPMPGTGAIATYAEMGGFGLRIVMSYAPNTLAQQFTVDVLYGTGILRNNHGVEVKN